MLQRASPRAVKTLVRLLKSFDEGVRAKAAATILQKVWPTGLHVELTGADGGPVAITDAVTREVIEHLTKLAAEVPETK